MTYLLLVLSIVGNILLFWYCRKLLTKYILDSETRKQFGNMITQYAESLESIYKLEEFYGEETLKKAINQTRFVQEACQDFKKIIEFEGTEVNFTEEDEDAQENGRDPGEIVLREGEKVSQEAGRYRRVVVAP
jgi:hypothetical protein